MTAVYNRKKKWIVRLYQIVNHMFWIYRQNDNYEIRTVSREELMPEGDEKVCFTGLPWTLRKIADLCKENTKDGVAEYLKDYFSLT